MKASLLYLVMSYAVLTLAAPQKVGHKGGQKVSQSVGQKSGRNSLHGGEKNQKNGQNGGRHINYGPLAKNNIPCSKRDNSYQENCGGAPKQANKYNRGCSAICRCRWGACESASTTVRALDWLLVSTIGPTANSSMAEPQVLAPVNPGPTMAELSILPSDQ